MPWIEFKGPIACLITTILCIKRVHAGAAGTKRQQQPRSHPIMPRTGGGEEVKSLGFFERVKEGIETIIVVHTEANHHHHHKETHGDNEDIDENTPLDYVKAPNVFERTKEEIQALVHTIHTRKEPHKPDTRYQSTEPCSRSEKTENDAKSSSLSATVTNKSETSTNSENSPRHHEIRGTSDGIDENTPVSEVKAPNLFERAKEELEAVVSAIHPRKESDIYISSPKKNAGFKQFIGRWLEKVCSPFSLKKD